MKCPKCGYISFDYNQVCPKCNKDISADGQKMNLPSYKPGSFSIPGLEVQGTGGGSTAQTQEPVFSPEETIELEFSGAQDSEESAAEESVDLLGRAQQTSDQEESLSFDLDDLTVSEENAEDQDSSDTAGEEDMNISLDLEGLDLDLDLEGPDDKSS